MKHKHEHEKRKAHGKPAVQKTGCPGFRGPCVISTAEYRKLVEEREQFRILLHAAKQTVEAQDKSLVDAKKAMGEMEATHKAYGERIERMEAQLRESRDSESRAWNANYVLDKKNKELAKKLAEFETATGEENAAAAEEKSDGE